MKLMLLAGGSLIALLPAPLLAQSAAPAPAASPIDTPIDEATPAPPPAPTGDPVLDRLNALEAKVDSLQSENKALRDQVDADQARIQSVEVRSSKAVQFGQYAWGPTLSDTNGKFTFHPRGMLELDYAKYWERRGGYDYNDGTQIRRGRFGFDGTAFGTFGYRIEAEYVNGTTNLLDAFISYSGIKNWSFTIGQQKAPAGLEANSSDAFNEFIERGMANVAFGRVGAERRMGITAQYAKGPITATAGIFGAGEAISRATNPTTPGEVYGFNGRVTFEPINEDGRVLHLGGSAYYTTHFGTNSVTLSSPPNSTVDGGNIESVPLTGARSAACVDTGVKNAVFLGAEAAGVYGPFSVQGEYSHLHLNRFDTLAGVALPDLNFDGFYAFGTFFITGESHGYKGGLIDRVKPIHNFDPNNGGWGAFELALRYDRLNLTNHNLSPLDRDAHSLTAALNWYLNGNVKLMMNYIRFTGLNSPLTAAPVAINGTTAKGDVFATRLHLDF